MLPQMDPALIELYESGPEDEEVSVILRLEEGASPPPDVRVVSRFDRIVTVRVPRGRIPQVHEADEVASVKAGDQVFVPPSPRGGEDESEGAPAEELAAEEAVAGLAARPVPEDGAGVVVGICDWGFDFTHANFRTGAGGTRFEVLWDQRGRGDRRAPEPFRYGRLLTRQAIDAALATPDPFATLQYHPAIADPTDTGAHATHVLDIIAGNRREPGSRVGLASGAGLACVHLGAQHLGDLQNLGDSVALLEGLDFCRRWAAGRPCVLHLSAGKTGGPHLGTTLLERAVDALLKSDPGIVLVQSVGNYADTAMHTHARIGPDQRHVLHWLIPGGDRTPNRLEVWYSGEDVLDATLTGPGGQAFRAALGERARIADGLETWGNLYHRKLEPNSDRNHLAIILRPSAPAGEWLLALHGREIVDGRLHAWIERDVAARYQSRFPRWQATSRYTTNTICNCYRAIAVGAHDPTRPDRPAARFSSRGPTADGRLKPEISAPGYRILAARSTPRDGWSGQRKLVVKSGTSMAAPWVSGTVALMFQAAGRPLSIHEVRAVLIGTADPTPGPDGQSSTRLGYGYLNVAKAVEAARALRGREAPAPTSGAPARDAPSEQGAEVEPETCGWAPVWVEGPPVFELEEVELEPAPPVEELPAAGEASDADPVEAAAPDAPGAEFTLGDLADARDDAEGEAEDEVGAEPGWATQEARAP